MKVIIFGAAGGIGKHAVSHALNKGYEVIGYMRNPDKLQINHEKLTKMKGQIDNYEEMKSAMNGVDAVVWCVGVNGDGNALAGHQLMLKAMRELGIKRLIDYGTPSYRSPKDVSSFTTWFPGFFAGIALKDAKKEIISIAEQTVSSDLDWSFIRFIMPTDKEYTGKVRTTYGKDKIKFAISRSDIAGFMIDEIENRKYVKNAPIIGS